MAAAAAAAASPHGDISLLVMKKKMQCESYQFTRTEVGVFMHEQSCARRQVALGLILSVIKRWRVIALRQTIE